MKNLKHTPAPWVATDDVTPKGQKMIFAKGVNTLIAYIQNEDVESDEERNANAKLIASAPELLEALIDFCIFFEQQDMQKHSFYKNAQIIKKKATE